MDEPQAGVHHPEPALPALHEITMSTSHTFLIAFVAAVLFTVINNVINNVITAQSKPKMGRVR
jgi:uncharacterized membrane protein YvlD (DUF360 family)